MRIFFILIVFSSISILLLGQSPLTSKQDLICKKWRLFQAISISDVLGEGIDTTTFSINVKAYLTYQFNNDNTYYIHSRVNDISSSDDGVNIEEGIWAFNLDSTLIGKKATKYNGRTINGNMSYDLDISKPSATELILKSPRGSGYYVYIPWN